MITNQDKPAVGQAEYSLSIGDSFLLNIGSLFSLIINPALAFDFFNTAKVASFETWSTIPTTWATESRTWLDCVSLFDNGDKPTTAFTNVAKPS